MNRISKHMASAVSMIGAAIVLFACGSVVGNVVISLILDESNSVTLDYTVWSSLWTNALVGLTSVWLLVMVVFSVLTGLVSLIVAYRRIYGKFDDWDHDRRKRR